ncbi:hypothetical protein [Actinoalloteichus fjordicus]|uniref:Uncharacterized protein n=1 Tax=Actinoalloteichus fjordicus TaxID=1612552 RepID=A0AAC9LCU7_9PSEU|nr:hypothetical protein [Actinoalloteichus fjordicus]APU14981.1 hypothetical protein UA74_14615 [Actinoalloteichus fjordicus]
MSARLPAGWLATRVSRSRPKGDLLAGTVRRTLCRSSRPATAEIAALAPEVVFLFTAESARVFDAGATEVMAIPIGPAGERARTMALVQSLTSGEKASGLR